MRLYREGLVKNDPWIELGDTDEVPASGALILSLDRWKAERTELKQRDSQLGVKIDPDEAVEDIRDDLDRLSLIVVTFPKFADGRGFSTARLLREKFGFDGEIRALGEVLSDQIPFMRRCGFDSFGVNDGPTQRLLESDALFKMPGFYQPALERSKADTPLRPWRRARVG